MLEFSDVLVTFIIMHPDYKIEPPYTFDDISFATGLDSPVSIDSLLNPLPRST